MRRYDIDFVDVCMVQSASGIYVDSEDVQRMRRRLLVKLLRERARSIGFERSARRFDPNSARLRYTYYWCLRVAKRIEAM